MYFVISDKIRGFHKAESFTICHIVMLSVAFAGIMITLGNVLAAKSLSYAFIKVCVIV